MRRRDVLRRRREVELVELRLPRSQECRQPLSTEAARQYAELHERVLHRAEARVGVQRQLRVQHAKAAERLLCERREATRLRPYT